MRQPPLDIHCAIDDGFALCGGNSVPRVPYDLFVHLGEAPVEASLTRWPWQRCPTCVAQVTLPPTTEELQ